ncbi:hypothetical protein B0A48_10005 [Cryoendolithus antarcticus]|uniref:Uncharacterized protein n=1 Tax=Cryoendolithus antarcticus TaxID=1507870 RepID=A0A1V8T3K9_9PEZI|nr:hypothetical protein B0A48_10005 [Cryoendolithus antarcticus]
MPIVTRRTHCQHHYHSNGRDYLASLLDWPSATILENFLRSDAVRPHLQHWVRLCYGTPHRLHEAVEWIKTGPKGFTIILVILRKASVTGVSSLESKKEQVEWENRREVWEQTFGEPFPSAEDEEVMDVESEGTGCEVGNGVMAKTLSGLSEASTEMDEPGTLGTDALPHEAVFDELPSPVNPAATIEEWRDGVERLTPDLAEFDDLAAILNQPDGKVRRGIKRLDLDARGSGLATPRSLVVGGRALRARG